jgi:hypothetical protein
MENDNLDIQTQDLFTSTDAEGRRRRAPKERESITLEDAATFVASATPIIGDAIAAKEVYDELQKDEPNYLLAGALGGAALVGLVPGLGDAAAAAMRRGAKMALDTAKRVEIDPNTLGTMGGNIRLKPKADPESSVQPSYTEAEFLEADDILDAWAKDEFSNAEMRKKMQAKGFTVVNKRISPTLSPFDIEVVGPDGFIKRWEDMPQGKSVNPQMSNTSYDELVKELDTAEDVKTWQTNAKNLIKEGRVVDPQIKTPELEDSTRLLLEGKISREEHLANIDKYKPVNPWDALPREPSDKAVVFSLDDAQRKDGFFVLDNAKEMGVTKSSLKVGDLFNGRLDIPAYNRYDTWIVTGSSKNAEKGKHYAKAVHYRAGENEPVKFIASTKTSEKIGTGEMNKTPYATVQGYVEDLDADAIRAKAAEYLNDPEWTQVGFDPRRQGGFYVRAGENKHVPVREATEVIQIGPLVLARNAKLDFDYQGYNEGGMTVDNQMDVIFKSSRGYAEGGEVEVDPVSGNEVPPGSMPEEVRDDIDARLSEGEYVVPADVVRYFGVKLFEDLRIQAKRGMAQMDAEGRIGGEPMSGMEIVEPEDDLPFNMEDLEVVEVMEMDEGGDVGYARRGMITSGDPDSPMGALGLGTEGLGIGATSSNVEMKKYVNEDGHSLMIMFINGVPQQVIPAGYFLEETEAVTTEEEDTTTDTDAEEITSAASSRDDDDPFKDIPMPEGVNYKELTYDEMVAMVKDNQSMKGDLVSTGMGIVNPILGIIVKLALMNSKRQLENEMKRRLDSKTLTAQEQSNLADLLKSSQEGRTGFMRALFGDEATTEAYTPIVTSGAPVNTSTVNALAGESSKAAAQKLKDDEAAARRRLAELRGIAASEDVADQVSGSTAGAAGTDPAVGTSDTTTGGVVGGYSTSDLADQYGSYGAGKPKPPGPSAKPYSSISGSNNSSAIESSLQNQNYYNNPSYTRAQPVSGPFNEGGLVKRRKKK